MSRETAQSPGRSHSAGVLETSVYATIALLESIFLDSEISGGTLCGNLCAMVVARGMEDCWVKDLLFNRFALRGRRSPVVKRSEDLAGLWEGSAR